jgi:hypothetical protein
LEETYVNDLPIWLCIAGFLYQMLHMLILIQFLFPSDGRHKQFTVPLVRSNSPYSSYCALLFHFLTLPRVLEYWVHYSSGQRMGKLEFLCPLFDHMYFLI